MKKRKTQPSRAEVKSRRTCLRCGRNCVHGRFCPPCLLVLREALSSVIWSSCVAVCLLAGMALLGVIAFGRRADASTTGLTYLAALEVWAQMTSLGLAVLLAGAVVTAVACLFWLDLRRLYEGHARVRVHRRDRRMAVRNLQVLLATISEANRQRRLEKVLEGNRPLPYWLWLVLMVAEGLRLAWRKLGQVVRKIARGSVVCLGIALALGSMGLRGLGRSVGRMGLGLRRQTPRLSRGLKQMLQWARRMGRWSVLRFQRHSPTMARAVQGAAASAGRAIAWLLKMTYRSAGGIFGVSIQILAALGLRLAEIFHSGSGKLRPTIQRTSGKSSQPEPKLRGSKTKDGRIACPHCGLDKPAPPDGVYACSRCQVVFLVSGLEAKIQATCPGCNKRKLVNKLGQFECADCSTRFVLTTEGARFQAACPGCGKTRMVNRSGRFQCSECSLVFQLRNGRSFIDATCPACGDHFHAPKPGFFRCQSCRTVFTVSPGRDAFLDSVGPQIDQEGKELLDKVQQIDQRRRQLDAATVPDQNRKPEAVESHA